jgi:transposase
MAKETTIGRPAKKIKIDLTEREEKEVDELTKQTGDIADKAKLLVLLASGDYTQPDLIKATNRTRQQILNFINRFKKYGMEAIKQKYIFSKTPIRQVKINKEQIVHLLEIAVTKPKDNDLAFEDWTLLHLMQYLEAKFSIKITRERIRQILSEHNTKYYTSRKMPN